MFFLIKKKKKLLATSHVMWDLSSLGRKQTHNPLQWSLNHWTPQGNPQDGILFVWSFIHLKTVCPPCWPCCPGQTVDFFSSLKCFCLPDLLPQRTAQLRVLILSMNQQPRSIFMETLWPQDCIFSDTGIGSERSSYKLLKMLSWNTAGLEKKKKKRRKCPCLISIYSEF